MFYGVSFLFLWSLTLHLLLGSIVSVVSVDDGNRDKVGLSRLRPLEEKFTKLPCQGLCCALSGVRPIKPTPQKTPGTL